MLAHCDLIAFIATTQPEQARVFYSEVLGLRLMEDTPFALVFDAYGTMLRIQKGCVAKRNSMFSLLGKEGRGKDIIWHQEKARRELLSRSAPLASSGILSSTRERRSCSCRKNASPAIHAPAERPARCRTGPGADCVHLCASQDEH